MVKLSNEKKCSISNATKKDIVLDVMFRCSKHNGQPNRVNPNDCKASNTSKLLKCVLSTFKKFSINPVEVNKCKIEVPFHPYNGVVVLEKTSVATSSNQPILHISYIDIDNVEFIIKDFVLKYGKS
jgi:hypothetical protein